MTKPCGGEGGGGGGGGHDPQKPIIFGGHMAQKLKKLKGFSKGKYEEIWQR